METPTNVHGKQKVGEAANPAQTLQAVPRASLVPVTESEVPTSPRPTDSVVDPAKHSTSSDILPAKLSPALLGTILQMITTAIYE
ncbi:UNVERIFIED_CONTAM: hypothetical protein Sangu_3001700 [Sesamum angustifolium]|uniref:Uncharacterized protein n=1 Tax=Sesamum angustifolium TaxID=2727405 RepID=A0AAW2KLS7_9LAMI